MAGRINTLQKVKLKGTVNTVQFNTLMYHICVGYMKFKMLQYS